MTSRSKYWALILIVLLAQSCRSKQGPSSEEQHSSIDTTLTSQTITDRSIYNLESEWTDQQGKTIKLPALAGKPRIAAMFFSHCDYACPKTIADMKSLLHALPKEMQDQVGMTLFSFDPKRDTYQRLDSVANDMELSASQWTLLTSTEPAAEELGAVLNVQYKGATDGQFSHSNAILILDPSGEVVHRQEGIGADPEASLIALRKMLKRKS